MLIIGNGRLITHNPSSPYIENGAVVIEDNKICDFGSNQDMQKAYPQSEFYDAKGRIIMPGLINTHSHIYSAFARGLALKQDKPNRNFLDILNNQWWRIDKALNEDDNLYSAYTTGLESVRLGVTTLFDHHASQYHIKGSLRALSSALTDIGLRHSLCYEVSDRDGQAQAQAGIAENIDFIDHAAQDKTDLKKGMFGLHASFTLSEQTLAACHQALGEREKAFHIHVAEDKADQADSLAKYGCRVVERLDKAGILGELTLAIHNIHIDQNELQLLQQSQTMAVHAPESNMGNAVGCAPVLDILNHGVLVGLGTDAYTQDMFESLKVTNIIHKHQAADPAIGFGESLAMLFNNNRQICARFFKQPLGIIAKNAYADLIIVDYRSGTPLNEHSLAGHLMFGLNGSQVDCTMINGRFIMQERQIISVDEPAILAQAQKQAADFWQRA